MFLLIKQLISIFDRKDYPKFFLLFLAILISSFFEILGIGLVLPFITLLSNPSLLQTNEKISFIYQIFNFQSFQQFMLVLAVAIIVVFIIKNIFLFFSSFWQARFVFSKQVFLTNKLFRAYLLSPYSFHLSFNFAKLQRNLFLIEQIMQGVVLSLFYVLTEIVIVVCLFSILLCMRPFLTLSIAALLGVIMWAYFQLTKQKLYVWGSVINTERALALQQIHQGLGSIKEVKLLGKEEFFIHRYRSAWETLSRFMARGNVVTTSIRFFTELVIVVVMMSLMIGFLLISQDFQKAFMTISLFAIVAVRLMPSLNRISSGLSTIRFYIRSFREVYDDIMFCEKRIKAHLVEKSDKKIVFNESIEVKQVSFTYENTTKVVLENVSLTIKKNSIVGFIGPSGAGKTTMIDIILGLLVPTKGQVLVDGEDIQQKLSSWQRKIGYIPQTIYLADDTIRNNIAFAVDKKDINEEHVWEALRLAQLEDFVKSLPQGLDTFVGERGVRLSGGQKQRIGIARALYNHPEIIVMDEATSALDNETEREFMKALDFLSGKKTILIIAHRLTTVQHCDNIFFFKEGKFLIEGTYNDLLSKSMDFQKMTLKK